MEGFRMNIPKMTAVGLAVALVFALPVVADEGSKAGERMAPAKTASAEEGGGVPRAAAAEAAEDVEETERSAESPESETEAHTAAEPEVDPAAPDSPSPGDPPETDPAPSRVPGDETGDEAGDQKGPEAGDPSGKAESPSPPDPAAGTDPAKTDGKPSPDSDAPEEKGKEAPGKGEAKKLPETRNREWILKMEDEPSAPKTPEVILDWTNPAQQKKCESYRTRLRDLFVRTRYYSIQGDSCATADHAQAALDLAETCRAECPKGFLKAGGYNDRILRNWRWLRELGSKQCLQ
jgi:hypothetical protein